MQPTVFPEPREAQPAAGRLRLDDPRVPVAAAAADPQQPGAEIRLGAAAGDLDLPPDPEGYTLVVDDRGVRLRGTTPAGTLHAAQSLRQLIEQEGRELGHVT